MQKYLLLLLVVFCLASCDDDHSQEEIALENLNELELKKQIAKAHYINSFTADITKLVVGTIVQYPLLHNSESSTSVSTRSNECPRILPDPNGITTLPDSGLTFDLICPERNFEYFVPASELNEFTAEGFIIVQPGCFRYTFREENLNGDLCYDVEIPENFIIDDQSIFKNEFILCDIENGKLRITNTENDIESKPETLLDNNLILTYDDVTVGKLGDCDADEIEFEPGELVFNYFCNCPIGGALNFDFQGLPVVVDFKENFACQGLVQATVNDVLFPTEDILFCQ